MRRKPQHLATILPQRYGNKECTKRLKVRPTESSLADVEHAPEPAPERTLSPGKDHASSAATHGTPETEACATSVPTNPIAATEHPGPSLHDDAPSDWDHFSELRERGLQNERQKSDPDNGWLEEVDWAIEVLKHEHSPRDMQAWAYIRGLTDSESLFSASDSCNVRA
ncbi:MAG: hypothetical protein Q9199_004734 [Rusavskia elegans]